MKFVISGGLGDAVSCMSKIISFKKLHQIKNDDIEIHYIRDSVDIEIANDSGMLTSNYVQWVHDICHINGWQFSFEIGNQKEVYERIYKEDPIAVLLGPNQCDIDDKWWKANTYEPKRGLHYGERPHEIKLIAHSFPCGFRFDKIDFGTNKKTIGIQVRFLEEYPTKVNSAWKDIVQFAKVTKAVLESGFNVCLIGETKREDIKSIADKCNSQINTPFLNAYNHLLSCDAFIGFNGFSTDLTVYQGMPTLYMFTNEIEFDCSIPEGAKKYVTLWNKNGKQDDLLEKTIEFIAKL